MSDPAFEGSPTSTAADITEAIDCLELSPSPSGSEGTLSENKTRLWIHPFIEAERFTRDNSEVVALWPNVSLFLISANPEGPNDESLEEANVLNKDLQSWANSQRNDEEMSRTTGEWRQRAEAMLESATREVNTRVGENHLSNSSVFDVKVVKAPQLNSSAQDLPGHFFKELEIADNESTGSPESFSPIADLSHGWDDIDETDRSTTLVWLYPYVTAEKIIEVQNGVDGATTVEVEFFYDVYLLTHEEAGQWTPLRKELEAFESDMMGWFSEQDYGYKPDPSSNWEASLGERLANFAEDLKRHPTGKEFIGQLTRNPHSEFEVVDSEELNACADDFPGWYISRIDEQDSPEETRPQQVEHWDHEDLASVKVSAWTVVPTESGSIRWPRRGAEA
ncbi:hypothetical protein JCM24511_05180 [Saitozyma sp. JCM 24511]|nr:hypothetical protein JCM24511_05180 [Saitozyma sp. JCM 24511]